MILSLIAVDPPDTTVDCVGRQSLFACILIVCLFDSKSRRTGTPPCLAKANLGLHVEENVHVKYR